MNYRHLFHAGNFADVFKHIVLTRIFKDFVKAKVESDPKFRQALLQEKAGVHLEVSAVNSAA